MAGCNPKNIIIPSDMRNMLRYRDGDTEDIVTVMLRMDAEADKYIDKEAAQCLRGANDYDTLRNVWKFVKSNIRYKTDRPGKEVVKSPAALFALKSGDCKSFSISEAALLRALGFKGIRYRFVAYGGSKQVTHVYIVCKLHGEDVVLDAVYGSFDGEEPYTWKKDIPAARSAKISGIGTAPKTNPFLQLFGLGLVAWALFK